MLPLPDHPMVYMAHTRGVSLRHDDALWSLAPHRPLCRHCYASATSNVPAAVPQHSAHTQEGDLLTMLSDTGLLLADVDSTSSTPIVRAEFMADQWSGGSVT
jgi:hypothetical protein